ncbi:hypothetical protein BH20CHL1_BH20CHL1_03120 [soil metagenome]
MRATIFCLLLSMILPACSAGGNLVVSADPTPTPNVSAPTPTRLPFAATQTAAVSEVPYIIERVVLATELADDGAPTEEVTVLSEEQQEIYLAIRARNIAGGTSFRAIWFEDDQIIGQSDERVAESNGDGQWVALPFRPIAQLNPAANHTVELVINDRRINVYAFRVGAGNPSDVIAEATLALGTDGEGEPVWPGETFDRFAPQLVLAVRISNMVDPTGMVFNSFWLRDDLLIDQRPPDGGQPQLTSDPPDPADRRMTCTLVPQVPLVPGEYSVTVLLNGSEIAGYPFTIASEDAAQATAEPTERVEATASPVASGVSVTDLFVASEIDEATGEPDSERVRVWETEAEESVPFYVSVALSDLRVDDVVSFSIGIRGSVIDRYQLPVAAFERGWLSTRVEMRSPDNPNDAVEYEIVVYVNDTRVRSANVLIESVAEEE